MTAALCAVALSGCNSVGDGWLWNSREPEPEDVAVAAPPPIEEPLVAEAPVLPAPVVPVQKPWDLGIELDDLIGLSQDQALEFFGTPLRMIDESPAVRWQYEDGVCALTLVFFPDLKTKRFVTLQYLVEGEQENVCLVRLARAHQRQ